MGKKKKKEEGKKGKSDYDRIGLFMEPGYMRPSLCPEFQFNISAHLGTQMSVEPFHPKDGTNAGYLTKFTRVFTGDDALSEPLKVLRHENYVKNKEVTAWVLTKPQSVLTPGLGMLYGTFAGPIEALSPVVRPAQGEEEIVGEEERAGPAKKFVTKYPQKGTGYGFPNVTINRYPSLFKPPARKLKIHKPMPVEERDIFNRFHHPRFFNKNPWMLPEDIHLKPMAPKPCRPFCIPFCCAKGKVLGGAKDGCFTPFSAYGPIKMRFRIPRLPKKVWPRRFKGKPAPLPTGAMKFPFPKPGPAFVSVVERNVKRSVNNKTYKTITGTTYLPGRKESRSLPPFHSASAGSQKRYELCRPVPRSL